MQLKRFLLATLTTVAVTVSHMSTFNGKARAAVSCHMTHVWHACRPVSHAH